MTRLARKIKVFEIRYGLEKPCCFKCGVIDSKIEFHHADNSTKCFNPSEAKNFEDFYNETEKCIPLCKKCHIELHKFNGGTQKAITLEKTMKWLNEGF